MTKLPKKTPYLVTKGGRYYLRIAVPKELVSIIGKKEHSEALGDLNKAQAEVQASRLGAEWQARFLRERHALGLAPHPPAPQPKSPAYEPRVATLDEVQAIAAMVGRSMLQADEEARIHGTLVSDHGHEFGIGQDPALSVPAAVSGRSMEGVSMQATDWLGAHGLDLPSDPTDRRHMLYVFAGAMAKARKGIRLRDEGEPIDTRPAISLPPSLGSPDGSELPPAEKPANALKLRDVFQLWSTKGKRPVLKTIETVENLVTIFEQVCGDPPLVQLTRRHGLQMRDHLIDAGLAPSTALDRMNWISTLIRFEMAEGQRITANPWANIRVEGADEPVIKRKPVSPHQMHALFSGELFQTYSLPTARNAGRDAAYWLPIMGVYTGARITELAQLLTGDVYEEAGLWIIDFRVTYPKWQRLKNRASWRRIPVQAELIRLGLLDYREAMHKAGHERLFPLAKVSEVNNAGGAFSSWFSKLKTAAGWGNETTYHSFRHGVETTLKRAKEPKSHIDRYTGHSGKDVADRTYTHLEARDLVETAAKVRLEGLELPRVFPPSGWSAPSLVPDVLKTARRGEA